MTEARVETSLEFPEGRISVSESGEVSFMFRDMDYISARGGDHTEFMGITLSKERSAEVLAFLAREKR